MTSPGTMTQSGALSILAPGTMIDGTDVNGNPWIVGDAFAAAQGTQSPFSRAVDLKGIAQFSVGATNVTIRGLSIGNSIAGGAPTQNLIESTSTGTRVEAVRLDGGATAACSPCPPQDSPNLVRLASSGAVVDNVEGRASRANAVLAGSAEIKNSWFHHNYRSGVAGSFNVLERNTVELTGRKLNNAIVNSGGVGVGGAVTSTLDATTEANLIRNNQSLGVTVQRNGNFTDDAVCGNGDTGISFNGGPTTSFVNGTGLATAYNDGHGLEFFSSAGNYPAGAIQFNDDSAFTANAQCGFANWLSTGITASAQNNQWRGATTTCTQSAGVDLCTTGFGPVVCSSIQSATDSLPMLDDYDVVVGSAPAFPMNASLTGQTVRVQGAGFNAIAGNPLPFPPPPAPVKCQPGASDVSGENCCRKAAKANECLPGAPPNAPADGSMCVAMVDPLAQWRPMKVTAVTPSTIFTEIPDPFMLCIGDAGVSYTQSIMVKKLDGFGIPRASQKDYCRNS
jgi:hypothetical protein